MSSNNPVSFCGDVPSAGLLREVIILDGYQYTDVPTVWKQVGDSYGIRSQSYHTLDLGRVITTQLPEDEKGLYGTLFGSSQYETNFRKIRAQAWEVSWDNRSFMTKCLRDHIEILYTTQKHFYLQFDDEMSRDPGLLLCPNQDYTTYFTPTYPIVPLGYTPINTNVGHAGNIVIYNDEILSTKRSFNVDNETGRVYFCEPLNSAAQVVMRYTWRSRVRVLARDLKPIDIAQTYYVGNIVFEQVRTNPRIDPWWSVAPCHIINPTDAGTDYQYSQPSGGNSAPSIPTKSVPSIPIGSLYYSLPTNSYGSNGLTIGDGNSGIVTDSTDSTDTTTGSNLGEGG